MTSPSGISGGEQEPRRAKPFSGQEQVPAPYSSAAHHQQVPQLRHRGWRHITKTQRVLAALTMGIGAMTFCCCAGIAIQKEADTLAEFLFPETLVAALFGSIIAAIAWFVLRRISKKSE